MAIRVNSYVRKTLYVISLVLLLGMLIVLKQKQEIQPCTSIIINLDAPIEKQLLTESLIINKLNEWYVNGLNGRAYNDIDIVDIEKRLEEFAAVKNAEVSFDLRGELRIDIEQRIPQIRIMPKGANSFYLDADFVEIPANGLESARVPISNGVFIPDVIKKVYTLSTYVQENEFLEALTEQIFVNSKGDLIIIPKVKNQTIVVGDTLNLEKKFTKLNDFYNEGLNKIGWSKYKTINLKYKDQIVCN